LSEANQHQKIANDLTHYGPSVAHVSRPHLLHQHVGGLDANPDHARQQAHHGVWSITGRVLETLQASKRAIISVSTDQVSEKRRVPP